MNKKTTSHLKNNFRLLIDGRSNSGKTYLLLRILSEVFENFEKVVLVCPTFKKNKTYQSDEFKNIIQSEKVLVCPCDFDEVESWVKISRIFLSSFKNTLIILDDIVCAEDFTKRTSEITKLAFSGRHEGISVVLVTQDFSTVPKRVRENMTKFIFFYNANKKQMENIFEKYLGYETKETKEKIVNFLRKNKHGYLFVNNESPYDFFTSV